MLNLGFFCLALLLTSAHGQDLDTLLQGLFGDSPPGQGAVSNNQQPPQTVAAQSQGAVGITPNQQSSATGDQGAQQIQQGSATGSQIAQPAQGQANIRPGDFRWGDWGQYGGCSVTCGQGLKTRQRVCYEYKTSQKGAFNNLLPLALIGGGSGSSGLSNLITLSLVSGNGGLLGAGGNGQAAEGTATFSQSDVLSCGGPSRSTLPCSLAACVAPPTPPPVIVPINCYTAWGPYGECSALCGNNAVKLRIRQCSCRDQITGQSTCTEPLTQAAPCLGLPPCVPITIPPTVITTNPPPPPVLGTWSNWSNWSGCSARCGVPLKETRERQCVGAPTCEGSFREIRDCQVVPCPTVGPTWTAWGPYSTCFQTCGPATKTRFRTCSVINQCIGDAVDITDCGNLPCPTLPPPPAWSAWGPYGACAQTCGPSTKSRLRTCSVIGQCFGNSFETIECNNLPCPTFPPPPTWSDWGSYSACTRTCGPSTKSRFRTCSVIGQCFGNGNAFETMECNNPPCPTLPPPPAWSDWGPYGACTQTCGPSTKSRFRTCSVTGQCFGNAIETMDCNNFPCPTLPPPPAWSDWGPYGACIQTCGPSTKSRFRTCSVIGQCFGNAFETMECSNRPCPTLPPPPTWSNWSAYGSCTESCGPADKSRFRSCSVIGQCAGASIEFSPCENAPCPTLPPPAAWGEWSVYSGCSNTCGEGQRTRFRTCSVLNGCPGIGFETLACEVAPCASWSNWGVFSSCTRTCGSGTRTRSRFCIGGGQCEGLSNEATSCADVPCLTTALPPVTQSEMGSWADYGPWGDCQRNVGGDGCSRTRYRACVGGLRCEGFSFDIRECSTGPCAVVVTPPPTTTPPATNPNQPFCDASSPEMRRDCGFPGISREECWEKGCCYSDVVYDVNWCFFDDFSGPSAAARGLLENADEGKSGSPPSSESADTMGETLDRA